MAKPQDQFFPVYRENNSSKGVNVQIIRIKGTNRYYATWHTHSKYANSKITKNVKKDSKSNKKQSKKMSEVVAGWTVQWYYRNGSDNTWILDRTSSYSAGTRSSVNELYDKPDTASAVKARVTIVSKQYEHIKKVGKKHKAEALKWFDFIYKNKSGTKINYRESATRSVDSVPATPSVSSFTIDGLTAKVMISYGANSADETLNDVTKIRIRVLKDSVSFVKPTKLPAGATWIEGTSPKVMAMELNVNSSTGQSQVEFDLDANGSYQVQANAGAEDDLGKNLWSDWSNWSSAVDTRPKTPENFSSEAYDHSTIRLRWDKIDNVSGYNVEYLADDGSHSDQYLLDMFENNIGVNAVSVDNKSSQNGIVSTLIPGLEKGYIYYFRVRSINATQQSDPSNIISAVIATKPSAPTTWSSATTLTVASQDTTEPAYLYWTHNSVDGSAQRRAAIDITIGDVSYTYYKDNTETDEVTGALIDKISEQELWSMHVNIPGEDYATVYDWFVDSNSNTIKWKVKTRGIGEEYSDWSIERTINAYVKPTLSIEVSDVNTYPIVIDATTTPSSQTPISYYVSIISESDYNAISNIGEDVRIENGTEVFARNYDTNEQLHVELNAFDVDLEPGSSYVLNVMVYMDSGLTAEALPYSFTPEWTDAEYNPTGYIVYNDTYRYADIYPECLGYIGIDSERESINYYAGASTPANALVGDVYFNTASHSLYIYDATKWILRKELGSGMWYVGTAFSSLIEPDDFTLAPESGIANAVAGDMYFDTGSGDIYRCSIGGAPSEALWEYEFNSLNPPADDVMLRVFRREKNGNFVEITTNNDGISTPVDNDSNIFIRDPHPSFGDCDYRIIAVDKKTGAISYNDLTEAIEETSVVIQWNEEWDYEDDDELFKGSVLEIPANIKINDSSNLDAALSEYIGRERPVSYYGTQKGERLSVNCEFDKSDEETLDTLRRLMIYPGDVYVREPSGLGYWAKVDASYSKEYRKMTIPVTFNITPVEGGK